jgi:nucleoside-diphosphate-sugar epimerase
MNILITGIHGFVGSNLVVALKTDHTIYGLDIIAPEKEGVVKTFSWNELEHIPDMDVLIHLAGKAHDTKNQRETQTYFNINTELTKKVFDKFLQSGAKQFIFFSSTKAAADSVGEGILTEDVVPHPVGPYGESKLAAEEYIRTQGASYMKHGESNKRIYILRPCMIHGPKNKGNLNLLYHVVSKGIPWPLGAFDNKRSFLSVENLIFILKQFIIQNPESGVYHLSDDDVVSTNELIKLIARTKGKKAKIWNCNKGFIKVIAKIGDICKLPLNTDRLRKLTENYVVSNQKVKHTLGISQLPVKSMEGLRRTLLTLK